MCTGDPAAAGAVEFDTDDGVDVDGDTCGVELVVCGLALAAACEEGSAVPLEARTTGEAGAGVDDDGGVVFVAAADSRLGGADAAASGACGLLQADRVAPARPRALAVSSDPSNYMVDVLSDKAGSFIDSSASSGKPFLLEVATFAPHAPYTPAPRYATAAKAVTYPKTPAYNAVPSAPPSWLKGHPALTPANQTAITTAYQKRVEADMAVDDMVGHVEQQLQAKGIAQNTYIVFSSDNGYHMGEYRLLPGKQTAFDTDVHVPLILTGPGVPAGHTSTQLTSNIDLAPTFESLGGAATGSNVDGVSLSGVWHGQQPGNWQQAVLIEHHGPNDNKGDPDAQNAAHADPPTYEAIRTADALYIRYSSGEQEYYNTTTDPNELTNSATKGVPPQLPKTLSALANCHSARVCQTAEKL